MIPLSALGGGLRPPGGGPQPGGMPGLAGMAAGIRGTPATAGTNPMSGMIPLGALGSASMGVKLPSGSPLPTMSPPAMSPPSGTPPPSMAPPGGPPPGTAAPPSSSGVPSGGGGPDLPQTPSKPASLKPEDKNDTLAEVGKAAKDYLDVLMPIAIPKEEEDSRPVPKQVQCLEDNTDLFKMFDADMHRFDPKVVRKGYHKMVQFVHPDKLGRESSAADKARFTKLKQAYTVLLDDQLRAVYRQYCFGISGSGGCPAQGHEVALAKALEMGRDLRKMGEERAIVLHKAAETGWAVQQKDQDGRNMRVDGRKTGHKFNFFNDISSSEDDEAEMEKERRGMSIQQIVERSPKYADSFLDRVRPLMLDPRISRPSAGGAFTVLDDLKVLDMLNDNPKMVQKHLRKVRSAVKQMNWAMTALLQHKESPWRGLEVKGSLAEHGIAKLLELIKSGIAFGKFSETHEEDLLKLFDTLHRLYMDIFERRGQELLRGAIQAELAVVYLLPESGGRLPDGTRVMLQDLSSRADLNGRGGVIGSWDYALQRYSVELEKDDAKRNSSGPKLISNPDLLGLDDVEDDDDMQEEVSKVELTIPKKIMVMPKNVLVDLEPPRRRLEDLVKNWNAWRGRPRSVSASQDAEAVAAALGPPLESMASYLQEAASAVGTASTSGSDGADLIEFECREALQGARNLAAKLLGETPEEPPPAPPINEPPPALVPVAGSGCEVSQALKEAAEVAAASIELRQKKKSRSRGRRRRSRSRSRRRRRHSSSESGK